MPSRLDLWLTVPSGLEEIAKHEVARTFDQVAVSHRGILRASAALAADDDAAAAAAAEPPAGVKLVVCCEQVWWLNLAGMGLTTAGALCAKSKYTFMAMIGFGTLPLFAATAGMNLAIMESVPAANRPFAVALGTLLMHVLGDVPAAPAVGALKDAWAPSCTPSDDGGIPDDATDECAAERDALRRVILACCVWLVWALIGFGGAWFVAARAIYARGAPCALCACGRGAIELRPSAGRARLNDFAQLRSSAPPVSLDADGPLFTGSAGGGGAHAPLLEEDHLEATTIPPSARSKRDP